MQVVFYNALNSNNMLLWNVNVISNELATSVLCLSHNDQWQIDLQANNIFQQGGATSAMPHYQPNTQCCRTF